jgi:hypothetical protein
VSPDEVIELRLLPAIRECERHLERLRYAASRGKALFPLSAESYLALSDPEVAILDQMLFRFGKLQDAMGQRLFSAILAAGQELRDDETFLDKLNRLEKLGALPSAIEWIKLRDLRNNAMHEYPDEPEINAASLSEVFGRVPELENCLSQARDYARDHFPLSGVVGDTKA